MNGIIACRAFGQFIRIGKSKHMLVAAATRTGKGVSIVIPNALTWQQSMVLLDVKLEAWVKTAGQRRQFGPVYLFNPFSDDGRTARWNPLSYVRLTPEHRNGDIEAIAAILYKDLGGDNPFWQEQGKKAFAGACAYLFDNYMDLVNTAWPYPDDDFPTLGNVYKLLAGAYTRPGEDLQKFLVSLLEKDFVGTDARTGLGSIAGQANETFTSSIATATVPLRIFNNPIVDAATSGNSFDLRTLRSKIQSIYVGVSPNKLVEAKGVMNLFFEQAIKLNGDQLPEHNPTLKYQCLFLLDEFAALGKVEIVPEATGWAAGYGIRFVIVIQSIAQLEAVYGAAVARSMVTNLGCQVIFTPREQRDAEEYSKMLGETTVRRKQRTRSYGQGSNVSHTEIIDRRALMNPDEVKTLDQAKAIVFFEGLPPIMADKIFYYKDRYFTKRVMDPPKVAKLKLGEKRSFTGPPRNKIHEAAMRAQSGKVAGG